MNIYMREHAEEVAAAFRRLFSHLPPGEIGDDEELDRDLDEERERVVIVRGADRYWLEWGYAIRERNGELTYFQEGRAVESPPGAN